MYNYIYKCCIYIILILPFQGRSQDILPCGSSQAREALIKNHPEILLEEEKFEAYAKQFVANYKQNHPSRSGPVIIPLVFHILHQGGAENISDAQILDQVRILNRDYNKENADTSNVVPSFKSIVANVGIEFRLANIDPSGNCTNGIDRKYTVQTYLGDDYSKLNTWPREKYLNVWVVSHIHGNFAGYAYYPGSVATIYNIPAMDGVIILDNYIGSIGTSGSITSRALTHEIGHCLNLEHPWGNTNTPGVACGDDDVEDTPITRGSNLVCNLGLSYCNPPVIENVQNYMDYSYCSVMFTEGQKARMMAAWTSDVAGRSTLTSYNNASAVGAAYAIIDPTPNLATYDSNYAAPTACSPVADFAVNKHFICTGGSVTFIDASGNGAVDNYLWEFPGGTPATSTDQNPQVQFTNPGWQYVKLTVSNSLGSSSKSDSLLVYVGDGTGPLYQAPYFESFEDPATFSNEWASINDDENNTFFQQANYTGYSGTKCVMLNNYFTRDNHDIDEIISPAIDLTTLSANQMNLSFFYSLASWNNNPATMLDSLVVYASANCGANWVPIYRKGGSGLVLGNYQAFWAPPLGDGSSWALVTANIPLSLRQSNVRFKFQVFSSVMGNNFYLDDINIGDAATDITMLSDINAVNLFPNPSTGQSILNLQLLRACKVSIRVLDLTGKAILNAYEGPMNEGDNQVSLNENAALPQGVYIIGIKAGESVMQKKMVVQ